VAPLVQRMGRRAGPLGSVARFHPGAGSVATGAGSVSSERLDGPKSRVRGSTP